MSGSGQPPHLFDEHLHVLVVFVVDALQVAQFLLLLHVVRLVFYVDALCILTMRRRSQSSEPIFLFAIRSAEYINMVLGGTVLNFKKLLMQI